MPCGTRKSRRSGPALAALWLVFCTALAGTPAHAAQQDAEELPQAEARTARTPAPDPISETSDHRLVWNYPRFRAIEWGISLAATGYFTYSVLGKGHDIDWTWRSTLPGDEATRDAWVAKSEAGRRRANNASNRLWHVVEFFPFADGLIVPLLTDNFNVDVAWQLTLINWQGVAVMGAINRLTHDFTRRARPALEGCAEEGDDYSHYCRSTSASPRQSFISGHAASVFYGAGATCAHHQAMPMYGHPIADTGICALGLALATTDGVLRVVADTHWLSDVVFGAIAGFGAGWGLAYGLHYATPLNALQKTGLMVIPLVDQKQLGLQVQGRL